MLPEELIGNAFARAVMYLNGHAEKMSIVDRSTLRRLTQMIDRYTDMTEFQPAELAWIRTQMPLYLSEEEREELSHGHHPENQ